MEIAQKFAARNRYIMAETILKAMKWDKAVVSAFDCVHNYIDIDNHMLRKGATSAQLGEQIIVRLICAMAVFLRRVKEMQIGITRRHTGRAGC